MAETVGIALGRDPLQRDLTPYEVLGVGRAASAGEVERGFKDGLMRRLPVQLLTTARVALERPNERGVIDLLLYDPAALTELNPCPLRDPDALQPDQRALTAQAWESALAARFPDVSLAHALAVLWYWWAVHGSSEGEPAPGDPSREERWRRAIGYWAMLVHDDSFWDKHLAGQTAGAEPLREAILERLADDLRKLPARAGAQDSESLDLALQTEVEAARTLALLGLRTKHGKLSCGPLMLRQYRLIGAVRSRVQTHLARNSGDLSLLRLRELLSDFAPIQGLLANRKPAEALACIDALTSSQRVLPEVSELRARALLELGREQASLERFDTALQYWSAGLLIAAGADLEQALRQEIAGVCRRQAAAVARQPERAIAMLEKGLALVRDESLELALAELVHRRGAELALAAKRQLASQSRDLREILESLTRALGDLERAAKLGSTLAGEDAALVSDLIREATHSPESLEWLRGAVQSRGQQAAPVLKERLATLLSNRAVETARDALRPDKTPRARQERLQEATLIQMRARRDARGVQSSFQCDLCGGSPGGQFFPFELPEEPRFQLCHSCATRRAPGLGRVSLATTPLAMLSTAERDLAEAVALDGAPVIRQNLDELRHLRERLLERAKKDLTGSKLRRFCEQYPARFAILLLAPILALVLYLFRSC